jgi:hypothetical protein
MNLVCIKKIIVEFQMDLNLGSKIVIPMTTFKLEMVFEDQCTQVQQVLIVFHDINFGFKYLTN